MGAGMKENAEGNIWAAAYKDRLKWNEGSDEFVRLGKRIIERRLNETCGFAELGPYMSHFIETDPNLPGWLQVRFGNRPMPGRRNITGGIAVESGPTLVYSRGPSGEMAVIMYPVKSDVANVEEDAIILRIGFIDYWGLHLGAQQDVRDLIAYAYVTSIDLKPTWGQRQRIRWLRFARRQIVNGEHKYPARTTAMWKLLGLVGSGSVTGIFRLLGPGFVGWLIGTYGNDWLKSLIH